ncbi:MAG: restriction endonuclease [Candidatus Eremiobacteraeota bacterium]|nr:restriction endonuclease [Candidatus Eremiobacteraeota bacterium]
MVKQVISEGLGYPIPPSFVRTQPRFVGQHFDVYIQKATNFQVWNEELDATRRYVLIHVNADDIVDAVKVVTGDRLAELDTTGTLTQKYQARFAQHTNPVGLLSTTDTPAVLAMIGGATLPGTRSVDYPSPGTVRPIGQLYASLSKLQGQTFSDLGSTQERNRGGELHKIVCKMLGYPEFEDDGSCPDIKNQLVEIKLQTSPTIDLGLVCPNDDEPLDIPLVGDTQLLHSDVRYLVVGARTDGVTVTIERVYLVTGADFFNHFPRFGGKVLNKKLQMHLPPGFFNS